MKGVEYKMMKGVEYKMKTKHYDVVVVGGGPSGIAAGLASARQGAKTLIIEKCGFLGGVAASGIPFINFFNRNKKQIIKGIAEEIYQNLRNKGACLEHKYPPKGHLDSITFIDPNWVKIITEEMLLEAKADLLYHTFAFGAEIEGKRLTAINIANKGGAQKITADCFVDATGDGDLAAFAGAEFEKGRPSDGLMQPMSLIFSLVNVDLQKLGNEWDEVPVNAKPVDGNKPYNIHPTTQLYEWYEILKKMDLFHDSGHHVWAGTLRDNELTYVNIVRVSKLDPTDPVELSMAEVEGRRQIKKLIGFFNKHIPGLEKAHIGSIASQIGIRESRRIIGEYMLTADDILSGRKFEDAISKNSYCIDIHNPEGKGWNAYFIKAEDASYDIPYRCLVPKNINGLLVAGRCISTTYEALASIRIMPSCMAIGQGAGTAAAISSSKKIAPREIDVKELRGMLKEDGAVI